MKGIEQTEGPDVFGDTLAATPDVIDMTVQDGTTATSQTADDDMPDEVKAAIAEQAAAAGVKEMTLQEVIDRIELAMMGMSNKNPNKMLLANCANGFRQLHHTITVLGDENERLKIVNAQLLQQLNDRAGSVGGVTLT